MVTFDSVNNEIWSLSQRRSSLVPMLQQRYPTKDSHQPVQSSSALRMYVDDDDRSVLSMNNFRNHQPPSPWRKLGGMPTVIMVIFALTIGFCMGYDQAYSKFKSEVQKISDAVERSDPIRYSATATPIEFLGQLQKTKSALMEKLWNEYGEYASVLIDKSNLDLVFQMSSESKSRYRRRMIQKILRKQSQPKDTVTFTWVTAGDVRAAGFGNHLGNSYSSMMDDTAREAFAAVGLQLVVKNHGLYNFPSGPALSLCMNDVYGSDIDVLNWDFSLADGDFKYRAALFGMRAALHPARPLLMMVDRGDDDRWQKFSWGEGKVGVGLFDTEGLEKLVYLHFPDSLKAIHLEQLAPAVRYLQCNGSPEGHRHCPSGASHHVCNDDLGALCRDNKFLIKDSCDAVKYQSDWNPGWKEHRLKGRLIGLYMIQLLQDALLELDAATQGVSHLLPKTRRDELLKKYEQHEGLDQFLLTNAVIHASILGRYGDKMADLVTPLLKRQATCIFSDDIHAVESGGSGIDRRLLRSTRRLQEVESKSNDEAAPVITESAREPQTGLPVQGLDSPLPVIHNNEPGLVVSDEVSNRIDFAANSTVPALAQSESVTAIPQQIETSTDFNGAHNSTETEAMTNVSAMPAPVDVAGGAETTATEVTVVNAVPVNDDGRKDESQASGAPDPLVSPPESEAPVQGTDVTVAVETLAEPQGVETKASELIVAIPPPESFETPPDDGSGAHEMSEVASTTEVIAVDSVQDVGPDVIDDGALKDHNKENEVTQIIIDSESLVADDNGSKKEASTVKEILPPLEPSLGEVTTANGVSKATVDGAVVDTGIDPGNSTFSISGVKAPLMEGGICKKVPFYQRDMLARIDEGESFVVELASDGESYLMACFRSCTSGNCIKAMEGLDSVKVSVGNVEIEVDGVPVTATHEIDSCHLFEGKSNGLMWKTRRDTFRIRFRVTEEGGAMLLYSVIAL